MNEKNNRRKNVLKDIEEDCNEAFDEKEWNCTHASDEDVE